ncbi:MAG: hypothetical protein L0154_19555 [Chloroflexi bacterium]|nr:hypothetical protein [Chloroflexota bacterium]
MMPKAKIIDEQDHFLALQNIDAYDLQENSEGLLTPEQVRMLERRVAMPNYIYRGAALALSLIVIAWLLLFMLRFFNLFTLVVSALVIGVLVISQSFVLWRQHFDKLVKHAEGRVQKPDFKRGILVGDEDNKLTRIKVLDKVVYDAIGQHQDYRVYYVTIRDTQYMVAAEMAE